MANHETVPTSAFTKGTAERRKSATSFSLPGFASSGTYSANFVITLSCLDRGHQVRRPAPHISHPRHCPLSPASLSETNLVKAHERECFGNIAALGAVLRLSPIGRATPIVGMEGQGYFQARLGKALRPIHLRRFNHSVAVPHSSLRIPARSG